MQNAGQILIALTNLTRQFLNCWLEYVLSQPVDMDVSVILSFLKSYVGLSVLDSSTQEDAANVAVVPNPVPSDNGAGDMMPQESYS
jgi:hypothetical protein